MYHQTLLNLLPPVTSINTKTLQKGSPNLRTMYVHASTYIHTCICLSICLSVLIYTYYANKTTLLLVRSSEHYCKWLNPTQAKTQATFNSYKYSFYPRAIKDWNNLPINVIKARDLDEFTYLYT